MNKGNKSAAMVEGMKVAQQAAKKLYRFVKSDDSKQDILSAAYEAVLLAWVTWNPEKGPWGAHAYTYAAEYAKREANKSKSVVTTRYAVHGVRAIAADADIMVHGEDGEALDFMVAPETVTESSEDRCIAAADLRSLYERASRVMRTMTSTQQRIAYSLLQSGLGEDVSVAEIAEQYGVTRPVVYRVRDALLAAARA